MGREQTGQDGEFRFSGATFCKQWSCNSWHQVQHCACTSQGAHLVRATSCRNSKHKLHLRERWHFTAAFLGSPTRGENTVCLLLWLLGQPGERMCCATLCYDCFVSQDRINMSAFPKAHHVSFQPFSSCLAYPGFRKWCEQQDNWCHKQDQWYIKILWK